MSGRLFRRNIQENMQANGPDENVSCNILHRLIGQWELLGGEMCRVLSRDVKLDFFP